MELEEKQEQKSQRVRLPCTAAKVVHCTTPDYDEISAPIDL